MGKPRSSLALSFLRERAPSFTESDLGWARDHVFGLGELTPLITEYPAVHQVLEPGTLLHQAAEQLARAGQLDPGLEDDLDDWFERRMAPLRKADRRFWRHVIDELRTLRAGGNLMPAGSPV